MNNNNSDILKAWWLLYGTFIFFPIIAGIDKFFNYLADWSIYLNPSLPLYLNISVGTFMYMLGIIEILIGLLVLIKPKLGGYAIMALLLIISVNLISMQSHYHEGYAHVMTHYDLALHDIALFISAYVFVILSKKLGKESI
ncbi:MAG: hypothetical protein K2X90_03430 [Candidatus Babeliaceae bacterium]|jgi:hypothetical protein|nr:hypothetical protein [Candidatus Babeliaceae bacterium]